MFLRNLPVALLLVLIAGPAQSSLVTYEYSGGTYDFIDDNPERFGGEERRQRYLDAQPTSMSGEFTIDTAALGGEDPLKDIDYTMDVCFEDGFAICEDDPIQSISYFDGVEQTFEVTKSRGPIANLEFEFSTNEDAEITSWNFVYLADIPDVFSSGPSGGDSVVEKGRALTRGPIVSGPSGEWSRVPGPAASILLALGALIIAAMRRGPSLPE